MNADRRSILDDRQTSKRTRAC